ncbi:MAG: SAM-dependent methyltransferase, partial [bacterium]
MNELDKQHQPPITFLGAGPGDPELVTVKGKRCLERADLVIYAGSLVADEVLQWTGEDCRTESSASMTLDEIVN